MGRTLVLIVSFVAVIRVVMQCFLPTSGGEVKYFSPTSGGEALRDDPANNGCEGDYRSQEGDESVLL